MESTYRDWERRRVHSRGGQVGRKGKVTLGDRERRRLLQLGICIVLFLTVFVGKGVFPERAAGMQEGLAQLIRSDTDFRAAFADLGRSISKGEPVLETLGDLCVEVFGGTRVTVQPPIETLLPSYVEEYTFLSSPVTVETMMAHRLGLKEVSNPAPMPAETEEVSQPLEGPPEEVTAEIPAEEPAIVHMEYSGRTLPANATMDKYALGLGKTVSPVEGGWVSSEFGWREHPVDGEEKFHNGIDMAVNTGTPIRAFADGTVDYIGESPIYGLYTQIRHANGVTTFYCHCKTLMVQQGKTVTAGDVIAESGDTGNAQGAHLHFEIKKDGLFLNPGYYME